MQNKHSFWENIEHLTANLNTLDAQQKLVELLVVVTFHFSGSASHTNKTWGEHNGKNHKLIRYYTIKKSAISGSVTG